MIGRAWTKVPIDSVSGHTQEMTQSAENGSKFESVVPRGMKMNMDYLCTPSCIHMSACIDVCLFVCLSVYLSCLSVCLMYVYLYVCK